MSAWSEQAWEIFLQRFWDSRPKGLSFVEYGKEDLETVLKKFTKSGQEIRTFHSGSFGVKALQTRGVMQLPVTRSRWIITRRPPQLEFNQPTCKHLKSPGELTLGMKKALEIAFSYNRTPGETTLIHIAKRLGVIDDFYGIDRGDGVMFTGGRQNAEGCTVVIGKNAVDFSGAQIEIDAAFEWPEIVVIVEGKSKLEQDSFEINQALLPYIKWHGLLPSKIVYSLVLLAELVGEELIYHCYDLIQDPSISPFGMKIQDSARYQFSKNNLSL